MLRYDTVSDQFVNSNEFDEGFSVDEVRAAMAQDIEDYAALLRAKATRGISAQEMASWSIKVAEARAILDGGDGGILAMEAQFRGVEPEALAQKVMTKASLMEGLEAACAGVSGRHRDHIATLETAEDILAYDWRAFWPEV